MRVIEQLKMDWLADSLGKKLDTQIEIISLTTIFEDVKKQSTRYGSVMEYYESKGVVYTKGIHAFKNNNILVELISVDEQEHVAIFIISSGGKKIIYAPCDVWEMIFYSSYENCNGSNNEGISMRTESEMYDHILEIAKNDDRIKAVYMNGSRTNKNVPKDIFQDYDIVYVVEDTQRFIEDKDWIRLFGEILYMQYPDENPNYPSDKKNSYGYLMQFEDGVRIDLTVQSVNHALQHIKDDKLCKILLDKENILPEIEVATDCQYWVKKPTKEQYLAACNEFWWCTNNIAKGLWREEIPYVQDMTNFCVRTQLIIMLNWKAGILTGWSVSTGKSSKYLHKWLSEEEWQMFLSTYFDGNVDNAWQSVWVMCELFEREAQFVGKKLGWKYNEKEGKAAQSFLEYVHRLSKNK